MLRLRQLLDSQAALLLGLLGLLLCSPGLNSGLLLHSSRLLDCPSLLQRSRLLGAACSASRASLLCR